MYYFITFMLWVQIFSVISRSLNLSKRHPREEMYTVEIDILTLIFEIVILFWVVYLKFS